MLSDKEIDYLEHQIPALPQAAVTQAYWQALAAGSCVLETDGDMLVKTFPDGTRKVIKQLAPRTFIKPEQSITTRLAIELQINIS